MSAPADATEKRVRGIERLRRDVLGLGIIATVSLCIGLSVNGLRQHPLPWRYRSPQDRLGVTVAQMSGNASVVSPWRSIGLDEFQAFVSAHKGTSIDARPATFYREGHVPGALSLPREDFEQAYARVRTSLEPEKGRPMVVYCSEADCKDSELVAEALGHLGYRQLFVYKDGWEEWSRAGLPQETGPAL